MSEPLSVKIKNILDKTGLPVYYADSNVTELPRISYFNVYNRTERLSNDRYRQRLIYQVDYFTDVPAELETDEHLIQIIELLESNGLRAGDWREVYQVDEDDEFTIYHYWIEVW